MKTTIFSDWQISDKISEGNFSTVYKAVGPNNCLSAIKHISFPKDKKELDKIIEMGLANNYNDANNYLMKIANNEIVIMKKFNGSSNIVNCFDAIIDNKEDGSGLDYYIRMEYIEDIKSYYSKGLIDVDEVVKLGIDICSALELCSTINLTHCDIKPENIFVGNDGNYKLGDFSSAFFNNDNNNENKNYYGSLNYISPEVYNGNGISKNTDLYSLGLVMYQLLCGNLPFISKNVDEKAAFNFRMSGKEIPVIRGVNKKLMDIIIKACSYNIKNRYNSPTDMKNDLNNLSHINSRKMKVVFSSNNIFESTVDINDPNLLSASSNMKNRSRLRLRDKYNIKAIVAFLIFVGIASVVGTTYALNRNCDTGHVNKKGRCVAGYYYCDEDYSLNEDNKCQKTIESKEAKVTYTCPSGYTLNGEHCVSNEVKKPKFVYKCASDYTLKGTKCEKTESKAATVTYECPKGYYPAEDNMCVKEFYQDAEEKYSCSDPTYTLNGKICLKNITKTEPAILTPTCPNEGNAQENQCYYTTEPEYSFFGPYCKKTGEYIYGKCRYPEAIHYTYTCNQGNLDGNNCKYTIPDKRDANVEYICPSGYVVSGNKCAGKTPVKSTLKYTCPSGMTLKGNKCYITITADAQGMYECPEGYIANGLTCIQSNLPTAIKKYSCSKVYTLNGGMCEKYEIINSNIHYIDE